MPCAVPHGTGFTKGAGTCYFELLAGVHSDTLFEGFIGWLARSPGARRQYEQGDDMSRAALVESYLSVVR